MRPQFDLAAFTAGEMASPFFARTDLSKYDTGLALCKNFFIDYKGGAKTRGGFRFTEYLPRNAVFFEFKLGLDLSSVLVVVTVGKAYFLYEGSYMAHAPVNVTAAAGNVLTAAGHGLAVGDLAYFAGAALPDDLYLVTAVSGNNVTLTFPHGEVPPEEGETGTLRKVRSVNVPYLDAELHSIKMSQSYLTATLTHVNHPRMRLTFNSATEAWTISELKTGSSIFPPEGLDRVNMKAGADGDSNVVFAVSSVDYDGVESIICPPIIVRGVVNYVTEAGFVAVAWKAMPGAAFYRVYRSVITDSEELDVWAQLGLIGETSSTSLVDNGIVPDYTISPQMNNDPFADGAILDINLTTGGSGYSYGTTLIVMDPTGTGFRGEVTVTAGVVTACTVEYGGTGYTDPHIYLYGTEGFGFVGRATVSGGVITAISVSEGGEDYLSGETRILSGTNTSLIAIPVLRDGKLRDVYIVSSGSGYTESTALTVSSDSGTGATISVRTVSPLSGNNPGTGVRFQQRQIYAGTINLPNAVFGSKPKAENDFNVSLNPNEGDSYLHLTDGESLIPIRNMMKYLNALLLFHDEGIDRLAGSEGKAVSALSKGIERQVSMKISSVTPLMIENTVIFTSKDGATVQAVEPAPYGDNLVSTDLSVLASHLFGQGKRPVSLAWGGMKDRLLWVVREDGRLLSLTFMRDQEVFAWAQHETNGFCRRVCAITENGETAVYVYVERGDLYSLERVVTWSEGNTEDYLGLDAALSFLGTERTSAISITENEDGTADITGLTLGEAGWMLRAAGGIYKLTEDYTASTSALIYSAATQLRPGTGRPLVTSWYLEEPKTEFSGLWHLEGQTVSALGDGDVFSDLEVEDGKVTFPVPVSRVHVGLPYAARLETLPLYSGQADVRGGSSMGRKQRPVAVKIRMESTRGLQYGMKGQDLWDMPASDTAFLGGPMLPTRNNLDQRLSASWNEDQQVVLQQSYPLPAFVVGLLVESELGD
jgi:hypothetical protein